MGKRGPAPTPTEILKLRGSARAKYDRKGEPEPEKGAPSFPDGMSDAAADVYNHVCDLTGDMQVLTVADGAQLERYARMYVLWRRAQEVIDQFDTWQKMAGALATKNYRAALSEARQLDTHLKQIESNFGLTPAARARLSCLINGASGEVHRNEQDERFFGAG